MKKRLILLITKDLSFKNEEEYEKMRDNLIEELEEDFSVDIEDEEELDAEDWEFEEENNED